MTLLIAYLLMHHMGITNPLWWVLVFFLWAIHVMFHAEKK
jgi:hypothetical protein